MEIIKTYKNTEYKVSNLGYIIEPSGKIATITTDNNGYCSVRINKKKTSLHRIVAETFLENPCNKTQVNHKNGDKSNNCVWNLEWCTPFENQMHRRYVLNKNMDGKNNPMYGVSGRNSPVYKEDIYQLDYCGNIINIVATTIEGAKLVNGKPSPITKCLSPKYKKAYSYKNFYWLYKSNYDKMLQADLKPREFMETLKKRDNHDPSLSEEGATTIESIG